MSILDPRRHTAMPSALGHVADRTDAVPATYVARTPYGGATIQTNGGGGVLFLPGATARQLTELRGWIDAAIARANALHDQQKETP